MASKEAVIITKHAYSNFQSVPSFFEGIAFRLRAEWQSHRSRFSEEWLIEMRRKSNGTAMNRLLFVVYALATVIVANCEQRQVERSSTIIESKANTNSEQRATLTPKGEQVRSSDQDSRKHPDPDGAWQPSQSSAQLCDWIRSDPDRLNIRTPQTVAWNSGPDFLPGLTTLRLTPAVEATANEVFGRPCEGLPNVWTLRLQVPKSPPRRDRDYVAVSHPMAVALNDGRTVLIATGSEANSRADTGFIVAATVDAPQTIVTFHNGFLEGYPGRLSVPLTQPLGGFHIWSEGGGMWQGYLQRWASVADLKGSVPQDLGTFPISAYFPSCETGYDDGFCLEYDLIELRYGERGADELHLRWAMTSWQRADPPNTSRRASVRKTELRASYTLRNGQYELFAGSEPPNV